jgi:hypothetical protein
MLLIMRVKLILQGNKIHLLNKLVGLMVEKTGVRRSPPKFVPIHLLLMRPTLKLTFCKLAAFFSRFSFGAVSSKGRALRTAVKL